MEKQSDLVKDFGFPKTQTVLRLTIRPCLTCPEKWCRDFCNEAHKAVQCAKFKKWRDSK